MRYELVDRGASVSGAPDAALLEEAGGSEVLAQLLRSRGIQTAEQAHSFLHPDVGQLHDPFAFRDMQDAVNLIRDAIASGRTICVHGDYDADGTSASALLKLALTKAGADVMVKIPKRDEDGYGLSMRAVEEMPKDALLITVDCGISNAAEVAAAKERGMDVIVTDHHTCPEEMPGADCVLNPKAPGETYPNENLCGAGVALKLAEAVVGREAAHEYLDLAAFATVADVMPLTGENRALVSLGLEKMKQNPTIGIAALIEHCAQSGKSVQASTVAYELAPAVNAAGRVSSAQFAYDLLSSTGTVKAAMLAKTLHELNVKRQEMQAQVLKEAFDMLSRQGIPDFIVLSSDTWDPGILGPAASRIAEQTGRPAILCARTKDGYVGSGRSAGQINLHDALSSASNLLDKFGGHMQAAGLTVREENLPMLRKTLADYVAARREQIAAKPVAEYDYELPLPADPGLVDTLSALEPFGTGNPVPIALVRDARIENLRSIGRDGQHASFQIRSGPGSIRGVIFGVQSSDVPPRADVLGELQLSGLQSRHGETEMIVRTLSSETREQQYFRKAVEALQRTGGPRRPEVFYRDKKRMGLIYSAFRAAAPGGVPVALPDLHWTAKKKIPDLTREESAFAYVVFRELGLISDQPDGKIQVVINTKKCDLNDSSIYRICGRSAHSGPEGQN